MSRYAQGREHESEKKNKRMRYLGNKMRRFEHNRGISDSFLPLGGACRPTDVAALILISGII